MTCWLPLLDMDISPWAGEIGAFFCFLVVLMVGVGLTGLVCVGACLLAAADTLLGLGGLGC
jgi:hypothetical protein